MGNDKDFSKLNYSERNKKSFWKWIVFVVSAILGGLYYFCCCNCLKDFSVLYGPPPLDDSLQQIIDKRLMQPALYGPPPINKIKQRRDRVNRLETFEP